MKTRATSLLKLIARSATVVLVLALAAACFSLYVGRLEYKSIYDERRFLALSPEEARLLVADLGSGDSNRVSSWRLHFAHALELQSNLPVESSRDDLDVLFELYQRREQPRRGDYFADLLSTLDSRRQIVRVSTNTLISYLGKADLNTNSTAGHWLRYNYSQEGVDCVALILVTNGMMSNVYYSRAEDLKQAAK